LQQLLILASIHQPSTTTFELFDKLFFLSAGKICYGGPVDNVRNYFDGIGFPVPASTNPAEFLLEIISADFGNSGGGAVERVRKIQFAWAESGEASAEAKQVNEQARLAQNAHLASEGQSRPGPLRITAAVLHRSFVKSYRDVVAYGIRVVMYLGMYPSPNVTEQS
jgi:hypothetical protein